MVSGKKGSDGPITIKKYANRRLYNTATSSYVTLEHLRDMVKEGVEFSVFDAKTGDEITRSVLAQIIFEEEGKQGQTMLPISFLRQLIKFYGDRLQAFVPSYLEMSMEGLAKNAENVRSTVTEAFGGKLSFGGMEELARQNAQMFQRALKVFSPFSRFGRAEADATATGVPSEASKGVDSDEISELKAQIEAMKKQVEALVNRSK